MTDLIANKRSAFADPAFSPGDASAKAERLFAIKSVIQTAIEARIQAKEFTRNNEAAVTLTLTSEDEGLLDLLNNREFATEFFIIAELEVKWSDHVSASARKTDLHLCPRCRKHEPLLESGLCERCDAVVS